MVPSKKIQNLSAWFLGRTPIISILNSLNERYGGFILAYHNPLIETVRMHLEALSRLKPVPLDEIVNRVKRGYGTRDIYAITVDDGVGKTIRNLSILAREKQIPITFFLPTSYLDSGKPYWFQRLSALSKNIKFEPIIFSGVDFDLKIKKQRQKMFSLVFAEFIKLKPQYAEDRFQAFIDNCVNNGLIKGDTNLGPTPISWEEVRQIGSDGLISFEPHSVSHPNLSVLSYKEIEREILESKRKIEYITGRVCRHFCYPFGSEAEIGKVAPIVCQKLVDSAVTMYRGRIDRASRWYLPRVPLYDEDSQRLAAFKISAARYLKVKLPIINDPLK